MVTSNFGRNVDLKPTAQYVPESESEILEILDQHRGQRIRCVGRLHSWSRVLEADDVLLDLRKLNEVQSDLVDGVQVVHVGAGCQIKRLLSELERQRGWTLPSVGFITEQSVAGAISTGTHGSGRNSLSHYVLSVRIARYDSDTGEAQIDTVSGGDELLASRCSLGCLGAIVSITMRCRPQYQVEESFREYAHISDVLDAEEKYPLQQFYLIPWRWTYFAQHRRETDARSSRILLLYLWYRFIVFDIAMHLLILTAVKILKIPVLVRTMFRRIIPACVIRNWSVVGPSTKQLVMEHELFRHVELELFVQRSQLQAALRFLKETLTVAGHRDASLGHELKSQIEKAQCAEQITNVRGVYCHHYPICVRKIQPDDTLISMASNAGTQTASSPQSVSPQPDECWYSITLTNYHLGAARQPFENLARFLAVSMSRLFGARPHWGKLCPLHPTELRTLYPAFSIFRDHCERADPAGVFRNEWTDKLLAVGDTASHQISEETFQKTDSTLESR